MKVNNLSNGVANIGQLSHEVQAPHAAEKVSDGVGDRVRLSDEAQFIRELQGKMGELDGIRASVVEQAQSDLVEGKIGSPEDLERTINALLMEL